MRRKQTDKEKLGPEPGCKISDELQEMLGDVVSKHLLVMPTLACYRVIISTT